MLEGEVEYEVIVLEEVIEGMVVVAVVIIIVAVPMVVVIVVLPLYCNTMQMTQGEMGVIRAC